MYKIISFFINILNGLNKFIWKGIIFLSKFIEPKHILKPDKPTDERYLKFKVDDPAIIEPFIELEKKNHKELIKINNIKPIKHRSNNNVDSKLKCPCCNAPSDYLYDNNGKGSQFKCKVCSHVFSSFPKKLEKIIFKCPHCEHKLELYHERNDFNVYRCNNKKCSYYIKNLNSMNAFDKSLYLKDPTKLKLHYIYRAFNIDLPKLSEDYRNFIDSPIDISKAYHSSYVIGLCLTYHINYGLSSRQTASILFDIHQIKISHQTVSNYAKAVSSIVHTVLEYYPYDLSSSIAADETYIKIRGKTNYIFFFFDSIKKIITSYRVFEKRDSTSAIKATYSTLIKYDTLPKDLKVISDGNPIYNVSHQYWSQRGYPFELYQVIGLTNQDDISKKYRSEKQIIERHNRTLKYYYRPKGGFSNLDDANNYMVLFSTCFNFLRPHSSLDYKTPVVDERISNCSNMPHKWIELITMGYEYTKIYT